MPARGGVTFLEILLALFILLLSIVPLYELLVTTTRATKLTREYLVAHNLAQLAFEQVSYYSTIDNAASFDKVVGLFTEAEAQKAPNGCPGVPVTNLSTSPSDTILPDDGVKDFNFQTGDPDFVSLFSKFSYSLVVTQAASTADTVVTTDSKASLARVDVKVFWKDERGQCQSLAYSDFISRRRY
jgi:hypothetical protein